MPVHPHACGDDMPCFGRTVTFAGSPPRVWGRRHRVRFAGLQIRFTPTRVGTTLPCLVSLGSGSVHPHACGDDDMGCVTTGTPRPQESG